MRQVFSLVLVTCMAAIVVGCASAPLDYPKQDSFAIEEVSETLQGIEALEWVDGNPEADGFYPLMEGFDAFGARLLLMDLAEKTLDAQYFLMKPDDAGLIFAAKMKAAADRGVRVRFLLDDIFSTVEDSDLAALDAHPNIEVRIFNPIARKGVGVFNYLGNFSQLNRRMHNKAFIVDNSVAIVGGRNIAAEYYQLETTGEFFDFDMISVGPIVRQVSSQFDIYWNHEFAVPIAALYMQDDPGKLAADYEELDQEMAATGDSVYAEAINTDVIRKLDSMEIRPYIANARLIADDPQKLLEDVDGEYQVVANELREIFLQAEQEIIILTPYLIPRKEGIALVNELQEKGVQVTIVTNSLATNNHTAVHSAYASYRKDLLKAGVELWEARPDAAKITLPDGETELDKLTLHAKAVLIDRKLTFVGSLNFDPRSIDINTEMGLLIDSPELGEFLTEDVRKSTPEIAYQVKLDERGKLSWHTTIDGKQVVETKDPQTSGWQRFNAWFLKIAPEKQL